MAEHLRQVFARKASLNRPVFVTFVTAGFPNPDSTVPLLLALEAGGADIIELGIPFSDPISDGAVIQDSVKVALSFDVNYAACLGFVKQARIEGLKAPVILMGYYNPILSYGEEGAVWDAKKAGANGFIVVDLPPEEAFKFRTACTSSGLSYVPLIAPSSSDERIRILSSVADSFIYVVSKMGTTGASTSVEDSIPQLLSRIRSLSVQPIPLAVGFGISTPSHFQQVGAVAEGVVIGSKILEVISHQPISSVPEVARAFCEEICGGPHDHQNLIPPQASGIREMVFDTITRVEPGQEPFHPLRSNPIHPSPGRFGEFGGQYVSESIIDGLAKLEASYHQAKSDPTFQEEFKSYYGYMNRPSSLYHANALTDKAQGARIWLKREDLNHTGSHKINNVLGQILLARRMGFKRIIAETGMGQHGLATATVCAKFGLECVIYVGSKDVKTQELKFSRMKMLGAKVVVVENGNQTLRDAINEAMRDWVKNLSTTYYLLGSAIGPHPVPTIVRDFQCVIGNEIKEQLQAQTGKLPDAVIASVGGGSHSIGAFYPFLEDHSVRLIGVEAQSSSTLTKGTKGVFHGMMSYFLQTSDGQIEDGQSISAGLNYPGVSPEQAFLKDIGRVEVRMATELEALQGFRMCARMEGIIPDLDTSHALLTTLEVARELGKGANVVLSFAGRGDMDEVENYGVI